MAKQLKYLLFAVVLFLSFGCPLDTDETREQIIEERLAKVEGEQLKYYLNLASKAAGGGRWRSGKTGGTSSDIDGIGCASLAENDWIKVLEISGTTVNEWTYIWDNDSTASEDATNYTIIEADDRDTNCSGQGSWLLASVNVAGVVTKAADGDHYANFSNSVEESYTESDGDCYTRRDRDITLCYDSTDGWVIQKTTAVKNYTAATQTIPYKYMYGGMITNFGAGATTEYDLEDAELNMEMCFVVATTQSYYIDPDVSDRIVSTSTTTNSDGDRLLNSGVIGDHVCIKSYTGSGGAIDWIVTAIRGSWSDGD